MSEENKPTSYERIAQAIKYRMSNTEYGEAYSRVLAMQELYAEEFVPWRLLAVLSDNVKLEQILVEEDVTDVKFEVTTWGEVRINGWSSVDVYLDANTDEPDFVDFPEIFGLDSTREDSPETYIEYVEKLCWGEVDKVNAHLPEELHLKLTFNEDNDVTLIDDFKYKVWLDVSLSFVNKCKKLEEQS